MAGIEPQAQAKLQRGRRDLFHWTTAAQERKIMFENGIYSSNTTYLYM